jgi:hypothetical protein
VSIQNPSGLKTFEMCTPTSKRCVKALARSRDSAQTVATKALRNPQSLTWVMKGIGKIFEYEMRKICATRVNSTLRSQDNNHLCFLPWRDVFDECLQHCPCLTNVLLSASASKIGHPNRKKIVSVIMCMLAKSGVPQ